MRHLQLSLSTVVCVLLFLSISIQSAGQNRYEKRIAQSGDDVEEYGPNSDNPGEVYFFSSDLEMVYDTLGAANRGRQTVGLRFIDIAIPRGAVILDAYIQFSSDGTQSEHTDLSFRAHDVAYAPAFDSPDFYLSTLSPLTNSVLWTDVPPWTGYGLQGKDQKTPDLSSLVQHIVNKPDWSQGSSMAFIIVGTGHRKTISWDTDPGKAPKLVVDYGNRINVNACGEYTSPSGKIWTESGIYLDTIPDSMGGDSIIQIELSVNQHTESNLSITACDRFTSPGGTILTVSGTYRDTIPNSAGCDSIITLDLTILNSSASSITESVCDSYTSPSGKTWAATGIYQDTIPNAVGCDSVITVDLTVDYNITIEVTQTVCGSYISPSGKIWTESGSYLDTIHSTSGCETIFSIDLTVHPAYTESILETICNGQSYSFNGTEYTNTGSYTVTFATAAGCDSVVTLHLEVQTIDTAITRIGTTLISNESNAQYQWYRDNSAIDGAVEQSYTVTETGNYSVEISKNNCIATSGSHAFELTSVFNRSFPTDLSIYPNPTEGTVTLDLGVEYETVYVHLYDMAGKMVSNDVFTSRQEITYFVEGDKGLYFMHLISGSGEQAVFKVIKQ